MFGTIALIQSKTFWGALVALIAAILQGVGLPDIAKTLLDPSFLSALLNLVTAIGAMVAILGRVVATAQIGSILPKKS